MRTKAKEQLVDNSWWSKSVGCRINLVTDLGTIVDIKERSTTLHRQKRIVMDDDPSKDGGIAFRFEIRDKVDKYKNTKCIMRVNNPNKTYWEVIIILLAIYNSFSIPIEIAFQPAFMEGAVFYVINTIIDVMFLADIVVNFRTTYYDTDNGEEVFDSSMISR
jgi:hypothetical protein